MRQYIKSAYLVNGLFDGLLEESNETVIKKKAMQPLWQKVEGTDHPLIVRSAKRIGDAICQTTRKKK